MIPKFEDGAVKLFLGDCLEVLPALNDLDCIVTDPPYGLGFMGKNWDHGVPGVEFWKRALAAVKPGAHLLAFGGTRTFHRLTCAIEDAGWEIRDCIMWVYGSGFPKSLDISKAIDKASGAERPIVCVNTNGSGAHNIKLNNHGKGDTGIGYMDGSGKVFNVTGAATEEAKKWQGWGTALKPAWEPIIVAMKPCDGTFAENAQKHGVAGLNVHRCRVEGIAGNGVWGSSNETCQEGRTFNQSPNGEGYRSKPVVVRAKGGKSGIHDELDVLGNGGLKKRIDRPPDTIGRWPANVIHDGSEEVLAGFPQSAGQAGDVKGTEPSHTGDNNSNCYGVYGRVPQPMRGDNGTAARFFYCAKASKEDRDEGCEGLPEKSKAERDGRDNTLNSKRDLRYEDRPLAITPPARNHHPTVKPTALMRYLCKLVCPLGGTVCDPFMGSGSTGKAALREGFKFVGIENDPAYIPIAIARIKQELKQPTLNFA